MNQPEIHLLTLCLQDDLFCALYHGLCALQQEWDIDSPAHLWVKALETRQNLRLCQRPDLLLPSLFASTPSKNDLITQSLVLYMLFTEDKAESATPLKDASPLKDALCQMIIQQGETAQTVMAAFRKSEEENERQGYQIEEGRQDDRRLPIEEEDSPSAATVSVRELIDEALRSHSSQYCRMLYILLSRLNALKQHIYESELQRLYDTTCQWEAQAHDPKNVMNLYQEGSCRFEAGSSMNGDVTGFTPIHPSNSFQQEHPNSFQIRHHDEYHQQI